ncbi:substrate-binding domain-containing protein [Parasporobacterium paucivorans]|uniref:Phosphate transport system substrate-binding protein n=1 Tax=Parasporobacterium paucivorans DSM 15970 TaxID=1122934 RepID=A0A1M6D6X7_9FIRM|nr:substrate-binding domain-containing protein [Parasporobacterium paucivorans]SHI68933.1 phosphate transport system substrate-binding protein [Parasporobacterium paucivorans DSM 15970]
MKKTVMGLIGLMICAGMITGCVGNDKNFDPKKGITVISREDGSGTRGAFSDLFELVVKTDDTQTDTTTLEAIIANKTGVVISDVVSDMYAIGYVSIGSLNESVKAVKINGVEAVGENVKNGTYEVSRPFNIAMNEKISDETQDFINYILSADGQAVVEESGYIQINSDTVRYEPTGASGKVVVSGSSSVSPLMEKLAEAYMGLNSGVSVEIQTSDSSTGMQNVMDGSCDIGMASRDLKESESSLKAMPIALDGIAIVVNTKNPLDNLTKEQVRNIFNGSIIKWSELN